MQLDQLDPEATTPLFRRLFFFFPDAASCLGRILRVCRGPKFGCWAKVNKSVCPGSLHKAHRAPHKSVHSQSAQRRASCHLTDYRAPTAALAPNIRGRGGGWSSPEKMHKTVQRETHNGIPALWFPLTSSKYKRIKKAATSRCTCILAFGRWLLLSHLLPGSEGQKL